MPMMPFIGVRISCDILARKSDFILVASSAAVTARRSSCSAARLAVMCLSACSSSPVSSREVISITELRSPCPTRVAMAIASSSGRVMERAEMAKPIPTSTAATPISDMMVSERLMSARARSALAITWPCCNRSSTLISSSRAFRAGSAMLFILSSAASC